MRSNSKSLTFAVTTILCLSALAACGGSNDATISPSSPAVASSDTAGGIDGEGQTLTVAVVPLTEVTPLYLAQKLGYFKDVNLNVKITQESNATSAIPSLLNNEVQLVLTNAEGAILAASKGLPIAYVQNLDDSYDAKGEPTNGLAVKQDSPITGLKDLTGKTVALTGLQSYGTLAISAAVDDSGGDQSQTKYVELPAQTQIAAVQTGKVDAALLLEPFLTQGIGDGLKILPNPFEVAFSKDTPSIGFDAAQSFVASHQAAIAAFKAAISKAMDYANQHPSDAIAEASTISGIPAEQLAKTKIPKWTPTISLPALQKLADTMLKYKYISAVPADLSKTFPTS